MKAAVCFTFFSLLLCGCTLPSKYPHPPEFPLSSCEDFNAKESNSAVSVCRSQFQKHRFFLEGKGFVNTPETSEQTARVFVTLLSIFGGGADAVSAHAQDPDRWERAADEYIRSRYGDEARIIHFGAWYWPANSRTSSDAFYVFEVESSGWELPWGEWHLYREESQDVKIEEIDIYCNDE
jgi:hypothetical protein